MNRAGLQIEHSPSSSGLRPELSAAQTFIADSVPLRNGLQDSRSTGLARPLNANQTSARGSDQFGERYPLAVPAARLVEIDDISIGSGSVCWMAGPRYVESIAQLREVAQAAKSCGLRFLRARAWWPWAREEDFDRHFMSGLSVLQNVAREFGLYVVSEIVHIRHLEAMTRLCDVIEVGGPVLTHQLLLSELGGCGKTILMNRASDMTVVDFLGAVEIVSRRARSKILLLESGSRGFDPAGDAVLDLSAIVALRQETNHPVFVDPTAVCRNTSHVRNMAVAAIAAGADGIVVELRPEQQAATQPGAAPHHGLTGTSLGEMIRHASAFKHTLNALTLSSAAPNGVAEREHGLDRNVISAAKRNSEAVSSVGSAPTGSSDSSSGKNGQSNSSNQKNVAKLGPMRRSFAAA